MVDELTDSNNVVVDICKCSIRQRTQLQITAIPVLSSYVKMLVYMFKGI